MLQPIYAACPQFPAHAHHNTWPPASALIVLKTTRPWLWHLRANPFVCCAMSLSIVTFTIVRSIAKAILKIWLKDQCILHDVILNLPNLLKSAAHAPAIAHLLGLEE